MTIFLKNMKTVGLCLLFFISLSSVVLASEGSGEHHDDSLAAEAEQQSGHVVGSINNIKIPKQLIKKMENLFIDEFKKSDPVRASSLSRTELMLNSNRKYLNLIVKVYDPNGKVLSRPVVFKPPNGGGIIDLGPFVGDYRDNFYFKINAYLDQGTGYETEPENVHVFYMSNAKQREFLDQEIGAGCNTFMDISSFYNYKLKHKGVKVNSTQRRFISILGGSYFFVYTKNDELYLASLKIVDSLGPQYLCRK